MAIFEVAIATTSILWMKILKYKFTQVTELAIYRILIRANHLHELKIMGLNHEVTPSRVQWKANSRKHPCRMEGSPSGV